MASPVTVHFLLLGLPFWIVLMIMVYGHAYNQRAYHHHFSTDALHADHPELRYQLWSEMCPAAIVTMLLLGGFFLQSRALYCLGALPLALIVWIWFENFTQIQWQSAHCASVLTLLFIVSLILIVVSDVVATG